MSANSGNPGEVIVPHDQWISFLDGFSRQHMNWVVTVEVASPAGRLIVVEQRRLKGISFDRADGWERAYIQVGDTPDEHILHTVDRPARITVKQSQTGEHQGIEITCADGSTTVIRFRTAARPEMLDGIAA